MSYCTVNLHITGHPIFVLVSTEQVMMCPAIDNSASCKIRSVIHFLHAENMSAAKVHHELFTVYSQNIMSEGTVRQLHRMFKEGQTNKCS
jgi:hypothetical protein